MDFLTKNAEKKQVLFVWHPQNLPEKVKEIVENLTKEVGKAGGVQVENVERLIMCKYVNCLEITLYEIIRGV